ncbi:ATP-dependent helicase [Yersinia enterocolitica]|uniref:UvrD-helicase domain-containing protein n=1 Tax=Yersinia enterocolitica TaxID=630 RepID=UPI001C8E7D38|nr:ATP-dependent helicase [Yersinia enterocolitica]MBX9477424.1 ATP-dependent helicase [Yersinia enterocolitica]
MKLSDEQLAAVSYPGNVYVSACPGSGKTRALTAKIIATISQNRPVKKVLALTYTNRAADEIEKRIDQLLTDGEEYLWAGTIHSFALEWILKPYAGYIPEINNGFSIIDEYEASNVIFEFKKEIKLGFYDKVNFSYDLGGNVYNDNRNKEWVEKSFRQHLLDNKKIDFDQVLYFAHRLLLDRKEIAQVLGGLFELICIDEIQDTQSLQYSIISSIYNESIVKQNLFLVGDFNQSIYDGFGASKSIAEVKKLFVDSDIKDFPFNDNYRSTQRLVDYFSVFRNVQGQLSKAEHSDDAGKIVFNDNNIGADLLPDEIAKIIREEIASGVSEKNICIIAPQWAPIKSMAKRLTTLVPEVRFDAPSLSPFFGQRDNVWFYVVKILLTDSSGRLFTSRLRWANKVLNAFIKYNHHLSDWKAKDLLKMMNTFTSEEKQGTLYLVEACAYLLESISLSFDDNESLKQSYDIFFEKANNNISKHSDQYDDDIDVFRCFFRESTGVVINSCHGVKGEEYDVVIAFGMLRGFIPHWADIYKSVAKADDSESKLLYVVCSRAKKNLYLLAEKRDYKGAFYQTAKLLKDYSYTYG